MAEYKEKTRDGEKVRELDCPEGYKAVDGKCVKMTARERLNRSRSAHKSKRVQGNKQKYIDKKRIDTIEKNENEIMEDKIRQIIREELHLLLKEGKISSEIKKMEKDVLYLLSYLDAKSIEIEDKERSLFYSGYDKIIQGFKQVYNSWKNHS